MYSNNPTSSYQTPEQVMTAANNTLSLANREQNAFDLLVNFMSGKRPRTWSPAFEEIMILMIDLSIKLNKAPFLREPLGNYKFISQNANITSLEHVLEHLIKETEAKHQAIADQALVAGNEQFLQMEDIDGDEVDDLFISSLNIDSKTQKDIIRNSWRCIWESYKIVVECISKNKKLEDYYAKITKKAFDFCKKYKRRVEFKRLCESMRNNLNTMIKSINNPDSQKNNFFTDISQPETNEKQMSIRFDQLIYAYEFELWQESLRILEDINNIMKFRKGSPPVKPKMLSDYFENLAKMFWKSEFFHYHAVAYFNHFNLLRTRSKNLAAEDLAAKASNFVLSVIVIPPLMNEQYQSEDAKAKAISLISSESTVPSRKELVDYIIRHNILEICSTEIKELFFLVEDHSDVLNLARKSEPLIKAIGSSYPLVQTQLTNVIIYKVLDQLSKIYSKLKISKFEGFLGSLRFQNCENIIHLSSISEFVKVRVDHRNQLLIFQNEAHDLQGLSMKFVNFSDAVKEIVYSVDERRDQATRVDTLKKYRDDARKYVEGAATALQERYKSISDLRKPERDPAKEAKAEEDKVKAQRAAEEKKTQQLELEKKQSIEQERARLQKKVEDATLTKKTNLLNELKQLKGIKIDKKPLENLTAQEIDALTLEKLEKAREQHKRDEKEKEENQIKRAFKKVDYTERARRDEQIKVLKNKWEESKAEKEQVMEIHKKNFDKLMDFKKKMETAKSFKETFTKGQLEKKEKEYEKDLKEFKEKIIKEFKNKILDAAKASLEKQKEEQEAEIKRREAELQKEKERLDADREKQIETGFSRSTKTREDLRKEEEQKGEAEKKKSEGMSRSTFTRGDGIKREDIKKDEPASTGFQRGTGIVRSEAPKTEEKPQSFGFSRNTEKTTQSSEQSGPPKFGNKKKEDDGGSAWRKPEAKPEPKAESKPADGGWRSTTKK